MEAARHLVALPDPQTGELLEISQASLEARIVQLEDELHEAQRMNRSLTHRLGDLQRDKQAEAEQSKHWPTATRLFSYWQRACNHPRAEWTYARFVLVEPYLKGRRYGLEVCLRAIAGARYDPFITRRKNGSMERFDSWELIFRDAGKVESFCNRAPRSWKLPQSARVML